MAIEPESAILNTPRCHLRPAVLADESLVRVAAADTSRIGQLMVHSAQWWVAHHYGLWILVDVKSHQPIGWCGLRPGDSPLNPELFYGLAPSAQGKGLASEAARAAVHYALTLPGIESVWAATRIDHAVSIAVMERIGMVFERRGNLDVVESVVYRIRRGAPGGTLP